MEFNKGPTPIDEMLKQIKEVTELMDKPNENNSEKKPLNREIFEAYARDGREIFFKRIPIINSIYSSGRYDGKYEGYVKASREYEKKLLEQAETFLTQKEIFEDQKRQYEALLEEYEQYIEEMSAKASLTNEEETHLNQILLTERKLLKNWYQRKL